MEQSSIRDTHIVFSRFKRNLLKFLHFQSRSSLFYIGDHLTPIFHTRFRLNFSALSYHLFQKNCCPSSTCVLCDASIEDVKHYFLYCPSFSVLREKLFTSGLGLALLAQQRWELLRPFVRSLTKAIIISCPAASAKLILEPMLGLFCKTIANF